MSGGPFFAYILAVALIALGIIGDPGALSIASADASTFKASADFSTVQGHRGWSYLDSSGAPLKYDAASGRWRGSELYLFLWPAGGHPGNGRGAMRRWTAPESGSIRVTGKVWDNDSRGGDGVEFVIRKNGSVIWRGTVANGNKAGLAYDLPVQVATQELRPGHHLQHLHERVHGRDAGAGAAEHQLDPVPGFSGLLRHARASRVVLP
jgi:hypothetical protein